MLLFLTLWALVPCLVLLTLYFLSSTGGKSGGNKKNDGVKVSPQEPAGLSLPETCGQALGKLLASLTAGDLTCRIQGQAALPRSPSLRSSGAHLSPCFLGADWAMAGGLGCLEPSQGADLEEASGALRGCDERVPEGRKWSLR